jgi:hypothetical protein
VKEEGSSATDSLSEDVTDVRKKKENQGRRKKEEGRKSMVSEVFRNLKSQISNCLS